MYEGYISVAEEVFGKNVTVAADRFHVAELYRRDFDNLRKQEMKRLKKKLPEKEYKKLKGAMRALRKTDSEPRYDERELLGRLFRYSPVLKGPPESLSCYCPGSGATHSFPPTCSLLTQIQLNNSCGILATGIVCPDIPASVSINSAIVVTGINAVVSGTASGDGIVERGFFWWNDTQSSGTIPVGYDAGDFSTTLTNLPANTKIFISAYIRAAGNLITAGNTKEITTGTPLFPSVITKSDFTVNGGNLLAKGEITDVGSSPVTIYGFVYATHPGPTVWDMALPFTWDMSLPISQGKTFEGTIKGLVPGQYYLRAYAHNTQGTSYGEEYAVTVSDSIDAADKYAWSENAGWLNFNSQNSGVIVYSDHLEGHAWHENAGWIRLGTFTAGTAHTYANTSNTDYGVNNDGYGNLSGYGWSENAGWINFRSAGCGVIIDSSGIFIGYAWSENMGWIHFTNTTPAYKVATKWLPGVAAYPLTLNTAGEGKGMIGGVGNYPSEADIVLTATPDADSVFVGWSPSPCAASFTMPGSDLKCTAIFNLKDRYAWSENAGWLIFDSYDNYAGSYAKVYSDHLEGYAWHENAGLIKLGTFTAGTAHTYSNTSSNTDYGVNKDGYGNLSGYAWSENAGWINFRSAGVGVSIDSNGNFSGYAWSENMGWIHFANTTPAYKVVTKWLPGGAKYTLTIEITGHGTGTVSGAGNYPEGAPVTISASPDTDSLFIEFSDCKESFNMPGHNITCHAVFMKKSNLYVKKEGTGNGNIGGGGGYKSGTFVKPTATASIGSKLAGWTSSVPALNCANGFYIPYESDVTCTAIFNKTSVVTATGTTATATTTVQGSVTKTRDNSAGGNAFMSWQIGGGVGTFIFKKPLSSVTLRISDNSGDTTLTAYGADDFVLKTVTVSGAALQSYTISNVGDILKIVVSSSNAYVEDVSYDTEIAPGDADFDGDATLTDTIIMLKILAGADFSETVYPEISLNRTQIGPEDVIANLQKVAGLR